MANIRIAAFHRIGVALADTDGVRPRYVDDILVGLEPIRILGVCLRQPINQGSNLCGRPLRGQISSHNRMGHPIHRR